MRRESSVYEYRARSDVDWDDVDDDTFVWDARYERLHRLNRSAATVWRTLATWTTVDDVVSALTFGDPDMRHDDAALDIARCIEDFVALGIAECRVPKRRNECDQKR